jgi:hypothetical protein
MRFDVTSRRSIDVKVVWWLLYPKIILRLESSRRSQAIPLTRYAYEAKCLWDYIRLLVVTDQTMMWVWDIPHRNVSGVVMWIECTATCLESRWIWLLEMSHAWGRVNLSSFVGLELLGAVIARQWWQEKRRLDYDSKSSNEIQTRPRSERSCAKNVCVWNWNRWCISLHIFPTTSVGIDLTRVRLDRIQYGTRRLN